MNEHDSRPTASNLEEAKIALRDQDWVAAIRGFLAAVQEAPKRSECYLGLIRSYEAAAEEYGDPELLEQASKVCRDALGLTLDESERAWVVATADRIEKALASQADEADEE